MLAIVAPGQGAQKPGMLEPWLDVPGSRELLKSYAEVSGLDLVRMGTEASADEIKDTAVTQPLLVASALLSAAALSLPASLAPSAVVAGHSVGELTAAALAGVLRDTDAVALAAVRGRAMKEACAATPTGMSAVLGGQTDVVLSALDDLGLTGANVNGGGQIVAAGAVEALAQLAAAPPAGTRIIGLPVAGAFHTHYMASAQSVFAERLASVSPTDTTHPLLSNADGSVRQGPGSGQEYLDLLVAQLTRPVRWDACMATLSALGVTGVLELMPGGTLVGLVKRELKQVATLAVKSPDDLEKAASFLAEHG